MKKIIGLLFMAFPLMFIACEETSDDPEDKKDINNPLLVVNIDKDISEDIIFYTDSVYVVDGTIRIKDAKLTFQPGTTVKFTLGSGFDVAYSSNETATIIALGTEEDPILFTSNEEIPNAGDWDGFRFYKGSNNCEFAYCTFEYGGKDEYYGFITIKNAEVAFTNCTIQKSANVGIRLKEEGKFDAFDGNTMKEIEDYPISIYANNIASISGTNTYETALGIWVENDEDFTNRGEDIWTNQGIPYYQEGTIRFGANGEGSKITIEAGTEIRFMEDAQWDVAYSSDKYATIVAIGTADEPIVFTSASTTPKAGDWKAIKLYEGSNNCVFDYCSFQYGGSNDYYGMVYMVESNAAFTNCSFMNSASDGILARANSEFSDFGGNDFQSILGYEISIYANSVHTITGVNTFSENSSIFISNDEDLNKQGDYVWTNQNVPYIIEGLLRIGAEGTGVKLTIEPGTKLHFFSGKGLQVPYSGNHYASLIAEGTADEPIIFTSADPSPSKGDWRGIEFRGGAQNCILNHCEINYAGSTGTSYGAITLIDAGTPLNISNLTISNSGNHGISVDKDKSSVDYTTNINFVDNASTDYHVR